MKKTFLEHQEKQICSLKQVNQKKLKYLYQMIPNNKDGLKSFNL
jgi:hypothetical protein